MKHYQLNRSIYYCPVDLTLSVVGGRWQGLIIWNLKNGPKRFNEIKKGLVTINDKMLSQTLKKLVEQEVLNRKSYQEIPPRVEYSLTEKGESLIPILTLMENWGEQFNKT